MRTDHCSDRQLKSVPKEGVPTGGWGGGGLKQVKNITFPCGR